MWMKWFPWRPLVKRLAKDRGFLDPFRLFAELQRFAQPSEVAVPVEILRLASVLHARGLMNSQAIQHNLDWVWPLWVHRQFDPRDPAFIPRAFSLSHINLTHRNWTAVGVPGYSDYPIVDPCGLVTPLFDSWSIDAWIVPEEGLPLIPSRMKSGVSQKLSWDGNLRVWTESGRGNLKLISIAEMAADPPFYGCRISVSAYSGRKAWCVISLRPYNPEGVSFIHEIGGLQEHNGWCVDNQEYVYLDQAPDRCAYSDYRNGDVYHFLPDSRYREKIVCDVGMATAAALYAVEGGTERKIGIEIPLKPPEPERKKYRTSGGIPESGRWEEILEPVCRLQIPDEKFRYLYDAAVRTLILHSPKDVYPGPYTYKHFWFRDAAFILHALLCAGLFDRVEKVIDSSFFSRQSPFGYFHSQDGEWDSNGQALWTLMKFCEITGRAPRREWEKPVEKGARWIERKRVRPGGESPHDGLFPPGFSAEHLGPNDYYYWDDFWGAAGLAAAGYFAQCFGKKLRAIELEMESNDFLNCIDRSLERAQKRLGLPAMPASPYRRMDTGAIGSLAGGYPLQLWNARDPRILATLEYLLKECIVEGGFFHDMSHSGINPYLTLHIAQVLLRAGDPRFYSVMKSVAGLASPTGQWPEAVHPVTKGGCMGDGQHVWAAAEWILMLRNCFVREEGGSLILFSGIPASWLETGEEISFGPAPTSFGPVELLLETAGEKIRARWHGDWRDREPELKILLPGLAAVTTQKGQEELEGVPEVRR